MYALFDRAMSDDEMRDWHDSISSAAISTPATEPQGPDNAWLPIVGDFRDWGPWIAHGGTKRPAHIRVSLDAEGPSDPAIYLTENGHGVGRNYSPTWDEITWYRLPISHGFYRLAARPDPQPAADTRVVTVAQLVWVPEDAPCTRFKAEALGGHMMIVELDPKTDPGKYSVGFDLGGLCFKFVLAEYDDFPPKYTAPAKFEGIERAKAAAQADYETRVLSAIIGNATPAPSDKIADAARALLDATPNPVFDMLKPVLIGEFSQSVKGSDEDGNEVTHKMAISWTVTKEIIAAALRALAGKGETP